MLRGKKVKLLIASFKKARFLLDKLRRRILNLSERDAIHAKIIKRVQVPIQIMTHILESHATKETYFSIIPCQELGNHIMEEKTYFVTFARKKCVTLGMVIILVANGKSIAITMSA